MYIVYTFVFMSNKIVSYLIDSCCFTTMPLSRFSDTFNIPHTKWVTPICLMFLIIIIMFDHWLLYGDMAPMG